MRSIEPDTRTHMARWWRWVVLSGLSVMNGCSVTGLDNASSRFNCTAPKGVPCSSTSGVYANSIAGTLPQTNVAPRAESNAMAAAQSTEDLPRPLRPPHPLQLNTTLHAPAALELPRRVVPGAGQAIRSMPKQLRVLIFPWVDADNDLHDQSYVYMAVDPGRWLIEHTRAAIRNDAPAPRLAGAPADAETDPVPAAPAAERTPPVVMPGVLPPRGPRADLPANPSLPPPLTPRVAPSLGIVEQRDE